MIRLKNQKLVDKENQVDQIVKHLEEQKGMLEQLKQSIQSDKPVFSDEIDKKIREEYKAYEQGYQSLHSEKENEIKTLDNNKILNEQDDILQGLVVESENLQSEIKSIKKQKSKENVLDEQKQLLDDKIQSLEFQQNSVEREWNKEKQHWKGKGKRLKE